jgi:hypothetical protein
MRRTQIARRQSAIVFPFAFRNSRRESATMQPFWRRSTGVRRNSQDHVAVALAGRDLATAITKASLLCKK